MEEKCESCKKEEGNFKFILRTLTGIGYQDKNFCSKSCLKEFVNKKSFLANLVKWK